MPPRARRLSRWPKELQWYDPKAYDRAREVVGLYWHGLLLERRRALNGTLAEAGEALVKFQRLPLLISEPFVSGERPLGSMTFDDLGLLGALFAEQSVKRAQQQWESQPPFPERVLRAVVHGGPRDAVSGELHDHHLALEGKDGEPHPLAKYATYAYLRVNLAVPDALLVKLFESWLQERRARLREAGLEQGAAPRRSRKTVAKIGPRQYRSWADLRVLDYLDLKLACRVAGIAEPTAQLMGAKLFPDDSARRGPAGRRVDTTDRFEQQTKPSAEKLMAPQYLEHFYEQLLSQFLAD